MFISWMYIVRSAGLLLLVAALSDRYPAIAANASSNTAKLTPADLSTIRGAVAVLFDRRGIEAPAAPRVGCT